MIGLTPVGDEAKYNRMKNPSDGVRRGPGRGGMSRRDFVKSGALASLLLGAGGCTAGVRPVGRDRRAPGEARSVIVLVSDGMSMGTLATADQFLQWRDGRHSHWVRLYQGGRGTRGIMDTASRNNLVTDSAAASSAWGCGERVNNGAVNTDPDGRPLTPVLMLAKAAGKGAGLVTTATVTHATPAGFGANQLHRNDQMGMALQYFEREYDVVLGGGWYFFDPELRDDGDDLFGRFTKSGYAVVKNSAELKAARGREKLLGTFTRGYLPYELDRLNQPDVKESIPSLAELSRHALESLSRNPNGFLLQIEGARVDHAAHANDIGALIFDQLAFDDAIGVALEFQKANPETLVIVTTDHGNSNPALNSGPDGGERCFSSLNRFRGTQRVLNLSAELTPDRIRDRFKEVMDLEITADQAELLRQRLNDEFRMPYGRMNPVSGVIGQVVAQHLDFGWAGNSHTADYVELFAQGPGSDRVKAFNRNTDLFDIMVDSLGLERAVLV